MKITEQCACGATFDVNGLGAEQAASTWRLTHACALRDPMLTLHPGASHPTPLRTGEDGKQAVSTPIRPGHKDWPTPDRR